MTELEDEEYEEDEGQEILPESLKVTEHLKATQAEVDESLSQDDEIELDGLPRLFKNKNITIIAMIALALCFLVVGMTVRYNNLIITYNNIADEANECRIRNSPMDYQPITDISIFSPIPDYEADDGRS